MNKLRLLMIVNDPSFFLSHRRAIAETALKNGYEVHVATGLGAGVNDIIALGLKHHSLSLSRSGMNPLRELFSLVSFYKLLRDVKPDICHLITIKPVLYGGIAARFLPSIAMVFAISGLGSVFTNKGVKARILLTLISRMYRFALTHKNSLVIFQNRDDQSRLMDTGAVEYKNTVLIKGSGVELSKYCYHPPKENLNLIIVMACRLLREKGVVEFIEAARIIRSRGLKIDFKLIGSIDLGNPKTITQNEIDVWRKEGIVSIVGFCNDMENQLRNSDIVTLPSYYGEGLPKVLIEAAACGRPVITTNHPGCRDAVLPDKSGLLIPIQSAVALANAIEILSKDSCLRLQMGEEGRRLAEKEFDINSVIDKHMKLYDKLMGDS
jgi:glycosyltransferase involved in cell wall biosynthesis